MTKRILQLAAMLGLVSLGAWAYVVPEVGPVGGPALRVVDTLLTMPFNVNSITNPVGMTICSGDTAVPSAGLIRWRYVIASGGCPGENGGLDISKYSLATIKDSIPGATWDTSGTAVIGSRIVINSIGGVPTSLVSHTVWRRHFEVVYTEPVTGTQHFSCDDCTGFSVP